MRMDKLTSRFQQAIADALLLQRAATTTTGDGDG